MQLIDTKEGAETACYIFSIQSPKQKKFIIQKLQPKFQQILDDQNARLILQFCPLFVDDVVFVKNTFIEHLKNNMSKVLGNPHLITIILLLLSQLERVQKEKTCTGCTDELLINVIHRALTISVCKKMVELRQEELRKLIVPVLVEYLTADKSTELLLTKTVFKEVFTQIINDMDQEIVIQILKKQVDGESIMLHNIGHFNLKNAIKALNKTTKAKM